MASSSELLRASQPNPSYLPIENGQMMQNGNAHCISLVYPNFSCSHLSRLDADWTNLLAFFCSMCRRSVKNKVMELASWKDSSGICGAYEILHTFIFFRQTFHKAFYRCWKTLGSAPTRSNLLSQHYFMSRV